MQQFESFAQMQRDAAMRVMEMQKRARAAMQHCPEPPCVPVPADAPDRSPLYEPERFPEEAGKGRKETGRGQEAVHFAESVDSVDAGDSPPGASGTAEGDESERALITAILLLLMREKADERLIFALLYILM